MFRLIQILSYSMLINRFNIDAANNCTAYKSEHPALYAWILNNLQLLCVRLCLKSSCIVVVKSFHYGYIWTSLSGQCSITLRLWSVHTESRYRHWC